MSESYTLTSALPEFSLWERMKVERKVFSFDLELTARCNQNCRHCYINLPIQDEGAKDKELSFAEIEGIAEEAVSLGAIWCLLTGGEPLLRGDFLDIYLGLKKKGLLVSVFTNATLITQEHINLFKKYPPRDIEVSVYGVTEETYERVTRMKGSFAKFMHGLELLLKNRIKVRFKAMALRSNVKELPEIARFSRQRTKDYFRFDPFLHLRFDADTERNEEIKFERLLTEEIVTIEKNDPERFQALGKGCDKPINPDSAHFDCDHLFHCGTGNGSFTVSYDGLFRLCASLWQKDCIYDLKKGTLSDAWQNFVPQVLGMRSKRKEFLEKCHKCPLINLCLWCPAHAHLESGELDKPSDYFCAIAHSRAEAISQNKK